MSYVYCFCEAWDILQTQDTIEGKDISHVTHHARANSKHQYLGYARFRIPSQFDCKLVKISIGGYHDSTFRVDPVQLRNDGCIVWISSPRDSRMDYH